MYFVVLVGSVKRRCVEVLKYLECTVMMYLRVSHGICMDADDMIHNVTVFLDVTPNGLLDTKNLLS
jgi:hypothetical protein